MNNSIIDNISNNNNINNNINNNNNNNNNNKWPTILSIEENIINENESLKKNNIIEDLRISIRYIIYTLITLPESTPTQPTTLYESSFGVTRLCMSIEKLLINNIIDNSNSNNHINNSNNHNHKVNLWNIITLIQNEYRIISQSDFLDIKGYSLILTDNGRARSYIRHLLNEKKTSEFFKKHKELLYKENSVLMSYYKSNSIMLDKSLVNLVFDILKKVDETRFSLIVNSSSFDTLVDHSSFNLIQQIDNSNSIVENNNNKKSDNCSELNDIKEIINNRNPSTSSFYINSNNNNNPDSIIAEYEFPNSIDIDKSRDSHLENKLSELTLYNNSINNINSNSISINYINNNNNNNNPNIIAENEDEINYSDLLDQNFKLNNGNNPTIVQKEDEINYSDLLDQKFNNHNIKQEEINYSSLLDNHSFQVPSFKTTAFNSIKNNNNINNNDNNSNYSSINNSNKTQEFPSPSNFNIQLPENSIFNQDDEELNFDNDNYLLRNEPTLDQLKPTTVINPSKVLKKTVLVKKKLIKKISKPLERNIDL